MNHGTQLFPAESAAMCGTDWFAFWPLTGFGALLEASADLAPPPVCEAPAFEWACDEPVPLPPELVEAPLVAVPVVAVPVVWVPDELELLGATGIVDSAVPLELDVLGLPLPLPFPPPTPGNADPYWSWEGEVAPADGASIAAVAAITASAIVNRGM